MGENPPFDRFRRVGHGKGRQLTTPLQSLSSTARFLAKLRPFLRHPYSAEECRAAAVRQLPARTANFLEAIGRIHVQAGSPYRRLLQHASITPADVAQLVAGSGVEGALERLRAEGVYVSLAEFKGQAPISRGSLSFAVIPEDFYNPLLSRDYETQTAGSSGLSSTRLINFDHIAQRAVYHSLFLEAFGLEGHAFAMWRPVPPPTDGIRNVLSHLKLGRPMEHWFTQNPLSWRQAKFVSALAASRLYGRPIPFPQHVPLSRAAHVARWLERKRRDRAPAWLDTNASSAVRICLAAREEGLDISGAFFRVGGEPYTEAKARVLVEAGGRGAVHYTMSEIGRVGLACAAPADLDEVHLLSDKLAIIQRPLEVGLGISVQAMYLTTVRASVPSIMLNVESGDHAVVEERDCGCLLQRIGFGTHVRRIRSYGKLTSEGMTFLGTDLLSLVEEVLPARFGGSPTDYQFVEEEEEEEEGGLSRMTIVVSPALGAVDEAAVVEAVLEFLAARRVRMAERWRAGQTLRVVRREPYRTGTAKILPLHIQRSDRP